ncbi:MAG: DUF488 domain-containing protein [Alphaproteobacteria bacterium]|nr:DUF488 domain-containing protein [Alphaproteobacteria bacterium]
MPDKRLFTIGYQGAGLDAFIACLKANGVTTLADIRFSPFSRRPEFCQAALRRAIEAAGLSYIHLKSLGNPPESRAAAQAGATDRYHTLFQRHLDTEPARTALEAVRSQAESGSVCLMCLERDPADCHRLMVADRLAETGALVVAHLDPAGPAMPAKPRADQPRLL